MTSYKNVLCKYIQNDMIQNINTDKLVYHEYGYSYSEINLIPRSLQ